ncbi:alpha/beta hydrolase family protein [Microbacterium sp. YY-01]|uniref:alpha/beta hydrolase family protein n=1 Tax=Microbacterium sp. YY-01 TaxID=3421634 RepID=UPI003D18331E
MKSLRHAAALSGIAIAGALVAGVVAGTAAVFAVARRVVTPTERVADTEILAVDTTSQTVELSRTLDTELPGRYGLFTTGSVDYVKIGAVLSADKTRVRRKLLTQIKPSHELGSRAAFSGWYYTEPEELHLPYSSVLIGTPHGPSPAWLFPGSGDTWVIHVHGRGASRAECLRGVPPLHAEGCTSLVVSYRNDGEGPRTRAGAYGLGATEWHDVETAVGYAVRHGAERVVLMGWSMGGAIVLQTALGSAHKNRIAGVILDSPVVDWERVLRYQAKEAGYPEAMTRLVMGALSRPWTARWGGAEQPIPFHELNLVERSDELEVPILILHSDDDGFVPSTGSHALAHARPDLVTMPTFAAARHTKIWNYDQQRWTQAISDWVRQHELQASDPAEAEHPENDHTA